MTHNKPLSWLCQLSTVAQALALLNQKLSSEFAQPVYCIAVWCVVLFRNIGSVSGQETRI